MSKEINDHCRCQERENDFLGFRDLTLFPYDSKLIDKSLLTKEELDQVNTYHNHVYNVLASKLEEPQRSWLESLCVEL